jgi:Tfp pilus assembly pilus retraction ATPase PilT
LGKQEKLKGKGLEPPQFSKVMTREGKFYVSEAEQNRFLQDIKIEKSVLKKIKSKNKKERVLACEVLIATDAVKRILRKDELFQIQTVIQTGAAYKMQGMSDAIRKYLEDGTIDTEIAMFYSQELSKYAI